MSIEGLLEESRNHGARYANYQSVFCGEAIYDATVCKSSSGIHLPSTLTASCSAPSTGGASTLLAKVAEAKDIVARALNGESVGGGGDAGEMATMRSEMDQLRVDNKKLTDTMNTILQKMAQLELRLAVGASPTTPRAEAPKKVEEDDEDIDLFASSDEEVDEDAEKLKQERLAAYHAKKSKKPGPIAKSSVLLDIKPWDDETDMKAMEVEVRKIEQDGLLWGAAKLVAVGYGIKKLQILAIVEDEKVSIDDLQEKITEDLEEFVQSVDIAAFSKI